MWKSHSVLCRDAQLVLDLCVDLLCIIVPLGWMWVSYMIPITSLEALTFLAVPSMFALGRLDELMDENVWQAKLNAMALVYNFCDARPVYDSRRKITDARLIALIEQFPDNCAE